MAGFGWNMRQGGNNNVHELDNKNHASRKTLFPPITQIACRICNKVFFNTQSLIKHIETHMVNYNELNNNQLTNPNYFHNNFTSQTTPLPLPPLPPPNPFLVTDPSRRSFLINQRPVTVPPAANLSLLTKKNIVFGPQLLTRDVFGQQALVHQRSSCSDFTKPFIDQLQKKIPDIERDYGNNNNNYNNRVYEPEMLDLTLKL